MNVRGCIVISMKFGITDNPRARCTVRNVIRSVLVKAAFIMYYEQVWYVVCYMLLVLAHGLFGLFLFLASLFAFEFGFIFGAVVRRSVFS